jgi:hypothetical protein
MQVKLSQQLVRQLVQQLVTQDAQHLMQQLP